MKKKRLAVEVTDRLHKLIKVWASRHGVTISAYVVDAVARKIAKEKE